MRMGAHMPCALNLFHANVFDNLICGQRKQSQMHHCILIIVLVLSSDTLDVVAPNSMLTANTVWGALRGRNCFYSDIIIV